MSTKAHAGHPTQGSLFEEGYLLRAHGDVVRLPDVALGELVANAWDAGAAKVVVAIPDGRGENLTVEDDGCGLTADAFRQRWMKLGYNRQKHQGGDAEFPAERSEWKRRAYGRNGQGRHGLLCFGDSYKVETWRDGTASVFEVITTTGKDPFVEKLLRKFEKDGHGTKLTVAVARHLPDPDRIRDLLSTRFLHDPRFVIEVNGESVPVDEHPNLVKALDLAVGAIRLKVLCIDGEASRTKHQSGVAFWVGNRLVGDPGWVVGNTQVHDGRTKTGRRLTFLVRTDDLHDEVLPDWTGFKKTGLMSEVFAAVIDAVQGVLKEVLKGRIGETRSEVMTENRTRIEQLGPSDQIEVAEMVEAVTNADPLADPKAISSAVLGMIEAKSKRSPQALIARIMQMPPEDIEGMHKLLDEWTVRDALTVLDEVGRRIKVIEALEKVMGDPKVDELHVIHPLVTQARWLFGPEYESPTYASNVSIRNAVQKVFGQKVKPEAFENPKKRPDLLFLPDSTLSAVATEDIDLASGISRLRVVLLIELKKGGSAIGREEMNQANGYIQDILACGLVDGAPHVVSFVVGHELSKGLIDYQEVGKPAQGTIQAMTFGQLVRTANARLFRVRDQVQERYAEQGAALVEWLAGRPAQMSLLGLIERPAPVQPIATVADPAPFRRITGAEVRPFANCVPIYDDLKIAAGPWSEERVIDSVPEIGEIPNPDDYAWVELPTGIMPDRRLFVARVIGESMNKRIPNGAWCLWRRHQGGEDRIGKVVLVQHRDIQDEGLGAEFTVKVYDAESMSPGGEGAREQLLGVALKPDSEDPSFTRIVLEGLQENELRVLAELVEVLL
jgi:hypothetical protein